MCYPICGMMHIKEALAANRRTLLFHFKKNISGFLTLSANLMFYCGYRVLILLFLLLLLLLLLLFLID